MKAELAAISEIGNITIIKNNAGRIDEIDKDTKNFLIKKNDENEDLLLEATKVYIAIVKYLWQIKLQKKFKLIISGYRY